MPNIVIEEIVNNITFNIEEVVSTYTIEVSEMQVPGAYGKSAYQSAIDGGFIGTELEFNDFLSDVGNKVDKVDGYSLTKNDLTDILKASYDSHLINTSNPHNVTKSQIGLGNVDNTSDTNKPISTATQTALNLKEDEINKGASLGYAPLDVNSKVPLENINDALLGNVHYQGLWNATTNTPNLDLVESKGHYYICTNTSETTRYGIIFNTGDWIISDGINWGKVDNTDAVSTVFGRVGNVTAQSGDYNTGQVTESTNKNYQTDVQKLFNDATSSIQTQFGNKQNVLTNPLTGVGSELDPNTYALQDGTILYHSVKWFVPTSTVSTSGTTVASIGTQFTSAMVGSKLIINGEWRIITAFTSTTVVTVASAYSVNYSGVVAGSFGVYSKSIEIINGEILFYSTTGNNRSRIDNRSIYLGDVYGTSSSYSLRGDFGLLLKNSLNITWSNSSNAETTRDLGFRRNAAGVLEIYDGITATGLEANRRDLLVRNVTASQFKLNALNTAPSSATATGILGEIRYDANYMYVCIATNTWKRSALTTW